MARPVEIETTCDYCQTSTFRRPGRRYWEYVVHFKENDRRQGRCPASNDPVVGPGMMVELVSGGRERALAPREGFLKRVIRRVRRSRA